MFEHQFIMKFVRFQMDLINFDDFENVNKKLPEPLIPKLGVDQKSPRPLPSEDTLSLKPQMLIPTRNIDFSEQNENLDESVTDANNPFDTAHKVSSDYGVDPFECNKRVEQKDLELKDGTT